MVLKGDLPFSSEVVTVALALDPAPAAIVIDMAGVSALDSSGVGTVVVAYRICAQVGVRMWVCNPSPFVLRLLQVAGVADRLTE